MSEDDVKTTKDEGKRPGVSLGLKSKKDRVGEDIVTRLAMNLPLAQPKTPVTSRLRKEAQAKAGAAERVIIWKKLY